MEQQIKAKLVETGIANFYGIKKNVAISDKAEIMQVVFETLASNGYDVHLPAETKSKDFTIIIRNDNGDYKLNLTAAALAKFGNRRGVNINRYFPTAEDIEREEKYQRRYK